MNGDNVFLIFRSLFPHIVPPCTNMFLQKGQQCITFSLSAFFLLFDPFHRIPLQLQCSLSSHPNLSALSFRPFCASFLYFCAALQFLRHSHFFTLLCFSLFLVLELTPASPCVLLYMFSPLTTPLSCSPPSNPDSSALFLFQRALLRVRVVGMCLICRRNTCFV